MNRSIFHLPAASGVALTALLSCAPLAVADEHADFFEKKIRPVLVEHCFKCHGDKKTENGLRVDSLEALIKGGDIGPGIVPGEPDKSLLILALKYEKEDLEMPPKGKLDDAIIADMEKWVKDGAHWPASVKPQTTDKKSDPKNHWALKPIANPPVPMVKNTAAAKNAIDAFLLADLEKKNLTPLPLADKRTLLRRATIDLTGLPPTLGEIDAFLKDESPAAFEKVIDRLLASPEYGRRWGRHWLDVARYADTSGDGTDMPLPTAYLYRDYVISAFNSDMHFDQFIREQIAGDILAFENPSDPRYQDKIVATGFIALSRRFGNSKFADMHLVVDETLDTISKGMLGVTVSCARCHDHKFDAVSQEDYYALAGYFTSTQYPHAGSEHGPDPSNLVAISPEDAAYTAHQNQLADLKFRIKRLERKVSRGNLPEDRQALAELKKQLETLNKTTPPGPVGKLAWAVTDRVDGTIGDAPMLMRGEPSRAGKTIPRGFISAIDGSKPSIDENESGRLELANWIASPKNPLTARVLANRIWLGHFGKGIVGTPDNLGMQGKPPTHPALLDHLASKLIEMKWSFKAMHKYVMMSAAYQRSSGLSDTNSASDPDNTLYWRFDRQRLSAEAMRDGMMFVTGDLNLDSPGAHPFPDLVKNRFTQGSPFRGVFPSKHRSVYLMTQRLQKHPFLGLFDGPDTNKATGKRDESTVPLQALYMMNSKFIAEQSALMGKRIVASAKDDASRAKWAIETVWSQAASDEDVTTAVEFVQAYMNSQPGSVDAAKRAEAAWASYAKVLMTSNAFLYVD